MRKWFGVYLRLRSHTANLMAIYCTVICACWILIFHFTNLVKKCPCWDGSYSRCRVGTHRRSWARARGERITASNSYVPHNSCWLPSFKRMIHGKRCGLNVWIQVVFWGFCPQNLNSFLQAKNKLSFCRLMELAKDFGFFFVIIYINTLHGKKNTHDRALKWLQLFPVYITEETNSNLF